MASQEDGEPRVLLGRLLISILSGVAVGQTVWWIGILFFSGIQHTPPLPVAGGAGGSELPHAWEMPSDAVFPRGVKPIPEPKPLPVELVGPPWPPPAPLPLGGGVTVMPMASLPQTNSSFGGLIGSAVVSPAPLMRLVTPPGHGRTLVIQRKITVTRVNRFR